MFASSKVCKFTRLQVCKFTKFTNDKSIIINFQLNKLQVRICKFASLKIYKIKQSRKLQINNYNFATLQVCKFTKLQNLEITN